MVIVDFTVDITADVVGSDYLGYDESNAKNTLKYNRVVEMDLSGSIPVTSSNTLTNSTIVFIIKPNKFSQVNEISNFTFGDVFSKLGGYLAMLAFVLGVFSSILILRWVVKFAEIIKEKYRQ